MQKKILIGDDHTLIRNGLTLLIRSMGYADVHAVESCSEIMKELARENYTHCVFDIKLTDGLILEILPNIRRLYPAMRLAIFSMNPPEVYRLPFRQFGIQYYIPKTATDEETNSMLSRFLNNDPYSLEDYTLIPPNPFSRLSEREHEVLHYVLNGMGSKVIADKLNLKTATISTLKNRIYEKTGAENEKQLSQLALMYNII